MGTVFRAKCIIAGDSTVGKSALTQAFHSDGAHFGKNYTMVCSKAQSARKLKSAQIGGFDGLETTGVDLQVKSVFVSDRLTSDNQDQVELYLFDSAGKEVFADYVQKFWRQPDVLMLVFDVTSEKSFTSCEKWLERIRSQKADGRVPGVLVGNKADLDIRRTVTTKEATEWAQSHGLQYFECSAKEQINVEQPFQHLANEFHRIYCEFTEQMKTIV